MKNLVTFALLLTCIINPIGAEAGIGVGYTGEGDSMENMSLLIPIQMGKNISLEYNLGIQRIQVSDESSHVFHIGYSIRFSSANLYNLPYFGLRLNVDRYPKRNSDDHPIVDVQIGPIFGGEYYISDNFSFGAEGRILVTRHNVALNPRYSVYSFRTQAMIAARFYF